MIVFFSWSSSFLWGATIVNSLPWRKKKRNYLRHCDRAPSSQNGSGDKVSVLNVRQSSCDCARTTTNAASNWGGEWRLLAWLRTELRVVKTNHLTFELKWHRSFPDTRPVDALQPWGNWACCSRETSLTSNQSPSRDRVMKGRVQSR